jgi:hypothetical protein
MGRAPRERCRGKTQKAAAKLIRAAPRDNAHLRARLPILRRGDVGSDFELSDHVYRDRQRRETLIKIVVRRPIEQIVVRKGAVAVDGDGAKVAPIARTDILYRARRQKDQLVVVTGVERQSGDLFAEDCRLNDGNLLHFGLRPCRDRDLFDDLPGYLKRDIARQVVGDAHLQALDALDAEVFLADCQTITSRR